MIGVPIGFATFLHIFSLYTPHWEQSSLIKASHTIAKLMEANYIYVLPFREHLGVRMHFSMHHKTSQSG